MAYELIFIGQQYLPLNDHLIKHSIPSFLVDDEEEEDYDEEDEEPMMDDDEEYDHDEL